MQARPLSQRKGDWFFLVAFSVFAATSLFVDLPLILGLERIQRVLAESYAPVDPLMMACPPFLRVAVAISGLVWGPMYVYLVWGFWRGRDQIRVPALMYSAAITMAMVLIFAEELWSTVPGWRTPAPARFLAMNAPYLIVPVLLAIRMRRPQPFR